jgi:hypothetical protein
MVWEPLWGKAGMKIAHFDCFSGASGDMILGALVAAGADEAALRHELSKLSIGDYALDIRPIRKQGFAAVKVNVTASGAPGHRHLHDILAILSHSGLSQRVKDRAESIFTKLALAEAAVHGTTTGRVHFHEVGAVDALVDVAGAAIGIELLGVERITCSSIPVGTGTVTCEHGVLPVPAPGTVELLKGVPLMACDEPGELTTPTGAAILTTLAESFGPMPSMMIESCGYGAGSREGVSRPNVLRLIVGCSADGHAECDQVTILETNLDDTTGEEIGCATEALFAAGALDVFTTPIFMKKNRPGVLLSIIAPSEKSGACAEVLFAQTRTFGVRQHECRRTKLRRQSRTVSTRFGEIRMKIGSRDGGTTIASPEYDDCAAAARQHGVPLREVMFEAQRVWRQSQGGD